jgi:uncharacterized membrane-anchored protein
MMSVRLGLILAVALQTAALVAMVGVKQWTLGTGTPVLLETRPVDPRSLFRGDYVILRYAINTLDAGLPGMPADIKHGETLYVTLREEAPYWKAVSVHSVRPEPMAGAVVIKGETQYGRSGAKTVEMRYGIEEYFVPEGEGRDIERTRRDGKVSILVAVDRFGNAGIKAVLIDGATRYEEKLF